MRIARNWHDASKIAMAVKKCCKCKYNSLTPHFIHNFSFSPLWVQKGAVRFPQSFLFRLKSPNSFSLSCNPIQKEQYSKLFPWHNYAALLVTFQNKNIWPNSRIIWPRLNYVFKIENVSQRNRRKSEKRERNEKEGSLGTSAGSGTKSVCSRRTEVI